MISPFRKIRQNLLKENQVTRYLAYAIGEIILVVIGILKICPVRDNLWVGKYNQEIQRAFRYAI